MAYSILDSAATLVGPPSGIVRWLRVHRRWLQDPNLYFASAELVDVSRLGGSKVKDINIVGGVGSVVNEAIASCLGEAVERYSAAFIPHKQVTIAREVDLKRTVGHKIVSPTRLLHFEPAQYADHAFPISQYVPEDEISWVLSWNVTSQERELVPAALVYFPFHPQTAGDRFAPQTTTGLGAGTSLYAAGLASLYELVERDALALMWHLKVSVPRVELQGSSSDLLRDVVDRSTSAGAEIQLFDISTNIGIPTYFAISLDAPPFPAITVGSAASLNPVRAARKAVMEASFTRGLAMRQMRAYDTTTLSLSRETHPVSSFGERALYYSSHNHLSAFDFLLNTTAHTTLNRWQALGPQKNGMIGEFWQGVRQLAGSCNSVNFVDVTTPDVGDLGIYVTRALSDTLQPLEGHSDLLQMVQYRCRTAYAGQGFQMSPIEEFGNESPHPLP